jgi:hypothetical protein
MRLQPRNTDHFSAKALSPINILLAIALLSDLLTPFLIWKGVLPAPTRWISSVIIVIVIAVAYFRMMVLDRIPSAILVIVAFSLIGAAVALLNGQGILATGWGLWLMFKYPLVGIYVYLQPSWPEQTPQRLRAICIAILTFEAIFQIGQYLMGFPPGDNLAGTFGRNGTGPLVHFTLFVLCLVLGQWIVERHWKNLGWVMLLGIVSGVLGEIKFFLPSSLVLLSLGIVMIIAQSGQVWKLVPYFLFLGVSALVFVAGYNTFVPGAVRRPIESFILDADTFKSYMNMEDESVNAKGYIVMGRGRAVQYGWDSITRDPITLIFGMGLGARSESKTLGTTGVAFSGSDSSYTRQSSLLVLMQETGLLGLTAIVVLILWIAISLFRAIRLDPQSPATELRYGLLMFSLLWPLWLYYALVWNQEVVMLLYWASLGYVLEEANRRQNSGLQSRFDALTSLNKMEAHT